jgi:hypothetical protein
MSLVDPLSCFCFWKGLNVRRTVEVSGIHNGHCIRIRYQEDRDQNMDDEIHRRNVVVVYDNSVERLLLGALLFFLDFFGSRICSEIHWRDYKPPPGPLGHLREAQI